MGIDQIKKTKIKAVVPTKSLSGDSLFLWLACRRIFSLLQVYGADAEETLAKAEEKAAEVIAENE